MADGYVLTPELAKRSGTGARNHANVAHLNVSGEFLTRPEIAKRLGLSRTCAAKRVKEVRAKHGNRLTWEMLA